jgi:hypothetical protein
LLSLSSKGRSRFQGSSPARVSAASQHLNLKLADSRHQPQHIPQHLLIVFL